MADFSKLPAELQALVPYLNDWAIADDGDREEKVDQISQTEKDELIAMVNPRFDAINNYLDTFSGGRVMPEEATLVGDLAQLVCELML